MAPQNADPPLKTERAAAGQAADPGGLGDGNEHFILYNDENPPSTLTGYIVDAHLMVIEVIR